jgi:hypothetical protein
MAWVAWYFAVMSGLIPTLFYWLKPWAAPSLSAVELQFALMVTLWAGLAAIALGLGARKSLIGRIAIGIGVLNVSIWMLMFVAGIASGSRTAGNVPELPAAPKPLTRSTPAPMPPGPSLSSQAAGAAPTEQLLAQYQWAPIPGPYLDREHLINAGGREVLRITNTTDSPLQLHLLTIDKPPITSMLYVLSGDIHYDFVSGAGYLEMWNIFPPAGPGMPEARYFSRTMGPPGSGPLAQISGDSDWRTFQLPFNRTGSASPPSRLEINLFLPGRGAVYLGPLKLTQLLDPYKDQLVINMRSDGAIFVDREAIPADKLAAKLTELARAWPARPVIIRTDASTTYQSIKKVLDLCKQAGLQNVAFANVPADTPAPPTPP